MKITPAEWRRRALQRATALERCIDLLARIKSEEPWTSRELDHVLGDAVAARPQPWDPEARA